MRCVSKSGAGQSGNSPEGPVTILLVLVGHGEVQGGQEESARGWMGKWANGGGGGDEKVVVTGDMRSTS